MSITYEVDAFLKSVLQLCRAIRDLRYDLDDLEAFVLSQVPPDPAEPEAAEKQKPALNRPEPD